VVKFYLLLHLYYFICYYYYIIFSSETEHNVSKTCTQLVRHSIGSMLVMSLSSRSMIADVPRWYKTWSRNCSCDFKNSNTCKTTIIILL